MKAFRSLFWKEWWGYFHGIVGYLYLAVFLVVSQWLFFRDFFVNGAVTLRWYFDLMPLLFVLYLPGLTMRLWAEERRLGTLELLLTAPLSYPALILAKFLSALAFLALSLALTLPLPLSLAWVAGGLDGGAVLGGYMATLLLGAAYLSLGLFLSSLSGSQLVAFLLTVTAMFGVYLLGNPGILQTFPPAVASFLQSVSLQQHFDSLSRGVLDLRDLVFFLSFVGFFLYANAWSLEWQR